MMDERTLAEWILVGDRLAVAGPEKLMDVLERLEAVAEAQELIAEYDWQLFLRPRRPTKRYEA